MITARELRLGNWVWNEVQNIPVKVDMRILQDQVYADKGFKEGWKPMPLTEEILLKCGFDYGTDDGINPWFSKDGFYINKSDWDDKFILEYFNIEIKHLNQLQNLFFTIVGKELEINF